jgi:8-oxo-dGTP pyrophosphatase MutT (NUDIX family)
MLKIAVGRGGMARVGVQRSAGGVIYQERDGEMWVTLIATKGGRVWGLPKGLIEEGEEPLQAAAREVQEESGLEGESVADLGHIEYWYRDANSKVLYHKFVHYFLLRYTSGDVADHGWVLLRERPRRDILRKRKTGARQRRRALEQPSS